MKTLKLLLCCFLLSGCATAIKTRQRAIGQGVYAIQNSLNAGRFDLAKKYSDELTKIVPPPSNQNKVTNIEATGTNYIVIPKEFNNSKAIWENSAEIKQIITTNLELKKSSEKEAKDLTLYKGKIGESMNMTINESEKPKSNGISGWLTASIGTLGVIGVAGACIAFPALIPLLSNLLSVIMNIINQLILGIATLIKRKL